MRTKVHKFCALLMLALLPTAVGCAARDLDFSPEGSNPPCPKSPWMDMEFEKSEIPIFINASGELYPDRAAHPLDLELFAQAHRRLDRYAQLGGDYDPEQVLAELQSRIRKLMTGNATLVVLIHGFNSTYSESHRAYIAVQRQLEHYYPGRNFVYLELFWDGLYGNPFAIWPRAQCNSKWAGLGLRKVLCRLDPATPVRVITHSRGAAVLCSALWNTDLRNTVEADAAYQKAQKALPPPVLPRLRAGLLAPAMRALDFEPYLDRGEGSFCWHDRILLGLNPDDAALNAGGLPELAGTTLGCRPAEFSRVVAPLLNRGRAHAFHVDFSGSVEHAFFDYVFRTAFTKTFLPLLLGDDDADAFVLARSR